MLVSPSDETLTRQLTRCSAPGSRVIVCFKGPAHVDPPFSLTASISDSNLPSMVS